MVVKRPMPFWMRQDLEKQKRRIDWYRTRSKRTGTGWPETQDGPPND